MEAVSLNIEPRTDKYTIEWKAMASTFDGLGEFKYAIITIYELWSIGHLTFKEPLKIEVYFDNEKIDRAFISYDFGMQDEISIIKENNMMYNYADENKDGDPIKTVFGTIKFDLMHAFFHYRGDPNYAHRHWALLGNLAIRVDWDDDFIFKDYENQNKDKIQG